MSIEFSTKLVRQLQYIGRRRHPNGEDDHFKIFFFTPFIYRRISDGGIPGFRDFFTYRYVAPWDWHLDLYLERYLLHYGLVFITMQPYNSYFVTLAVL